MLVKSITKFRKKNEYIEHVWNIINISQDKYYLYDCIQNQNKFFKINIYNENNKFIKYITMYCNFLIKK